MHGGSFPFSSIPGRSRLSPDCHRSGGYKAANFFDGPPSSRPFSFLETAVNTPQSYIHVHVNPSMHYLTPLYLLFLPITTALPDPALRLQVVPDQARRPIGRVQNMLVQIGLSGPVHDVCWNLGGKKPSHLLSSKTEANELTKNFRLLHHGTMLPRALLLLGVW